MVPSLQAHRNCTMLVIDAHTHIFPDSQAASILQNTARMFNVRTYGAATASDLIEQMDKNGIAFAAIHMVAPGPAHVRDTNSWLIGLDRDRLIKFGTLHPDYRNVRDEIRRLADSGVRGIKFQPDVQQFTPDDRMRTYPVYEELAKHNLTVMFHVGGEPLPAPSNRSRPEMIGRIAQDFPQLTIIAAHLGGLNMWEQVYEHLAGLRNIYMESSLSYRFISPCLAEKIIAKHGYKKIFFGTDYPFAPIGESLKAARSVPFLTPLQREAILGLNARDFFFGP